MDRTVATNSTATTASTQMLTSHLAKVFAQYPIEVQRGEGVWLYARDNRKTNQTKECAGCGTAAKIDVEAE